MTAEPVTALDCFRCGQHGHDIASEQCPWRVKAATKADHEARIAEFVRRYWDFEITARQKQNLIRDENELEARKT